jgi:CCR4-NOT transcription complex subunit 7/8
VPQGTCTWQFNFKFDVNNEKKLNASIKVLREAGINFDMHESIGIDAQLFAQYLTTSGLVFNDDVTWI